MNNILEFIRSDLKAAADDKVKSGQEHYFKEPILVYGVTNPKVAKIAAEHFKNIKAQSKESIFQLCEDLFKSGYSEEAFVACDWASRRHRDFEPEDFATFERWVSRYVSNWAVCDTLCNHTVGDFIEKYPRYITPLQKWTKSENRWCRRAAAVTFVLPARKGKFLKEILEIADILLTDKDDMVQKGYGWMLKEASKAHLADIFDYIMRNKEIMPRTALRYAIEKMPEDMKARAMAK